MSNYFTKLLIFSGVAFTTISGFSPSHSTFSRSSSFHGRTFVTIRNTQHKQATCRNRKNTSLSMFLQDTGGFLGIGAPEIATIALVGYFVLGPEDLYKLTKEIGKFVTNLRSVAADTTAQFENTMEDQLQMKELQAASRELSDAFSFRRSINYDEDIPESAISKSEDIASSTASVSPVSDSTSEDGTQKKKKRRRKKKKIVQAPEEIPQDLPMPVDNADDVWFNQDSMSSTAFENSNDDFSSRESRMARLQGEDTDIFDKPMFSEASELAAAEKAQAKYAAQLKQNSNQSMSEQGLDMGDLSKFDAAEEADAQARFASQMSQEWNESIVNNSEKLEPLAKVMERLAILEEERNAAEKRLEEEFRLRTDLEEKFYKDKRQILEEAAAEIQADAYSNLDANSSANGSSNANQT